eukprot:gnl/MRDRNA2_/MRDRNA2_77579_c0_seq3.p1 gnl/MRDRNA2_/MRDRNA2_77579_c0~~gnl/MRDRNA2_/MRDRNA2_77579_c0_seq3.p1  ORF type:complete len:479 (-),score=58.31 gnl/MRDRNA2_/MRDRNA2_77579_c0_seq3:111-1547(-)
MSLREDLLMRCPARRMVTSALAVLLVGLGLSNSARDSLTSTLHKITINHKPAQCAKTSRETRLKRKVGDHRVRVSTKASLDPITASGRTPSGSLQAMADIMTEKPSNAIVPFTSASTSAAASAGHNIITLSVPSRFIQIDSTTRNDTFQSSYKRFNDTQNLSSSKKAQIRLLTAGKGKGKGFRSQKRKDLTSHAVRLGSNRALTRGHLQPPKKAGLIEFEPRIHFERSSGASFRQVVLNAMRFFDLRFTLDNKWHQRDETAEPFKVCKGKIWRLRAEVMALQDAYFDVRGSTMDFVMKGMTLKTSQRFDFSLKFGKRAPCTGDIGMTWGITKADVRMRFNTKTFTGDCTYDNVRIKLTKAVNKWAPDAVVKLSAKMLTHKFGFVPLLGTECLKLMCEQFRTRKDSLFADLSRQANSQNKKVDEIDEVLEEPYIPMGVKIGGVFGILGVIGLFIACCYGCQHCGWKYHERKMMQLNEQW